MDAKEMNASATFKHASFEPKAARRNEVLAEAGQVLFSSILARA
jgi:hypothetical protein